MANVIEFTIKGRDQSGAAFQSARAGIAGLTTAMAAISATAAAAGAALFGIVKSGAQLQDEMRRAALITGENIETLSRLAHAANLSDVSLDSLTTSFSFAQRAMVEAANGGEQMQEAFKSVGITYRDTTGNVRAGSDILADLAQRLEDGADRATVMAAGTQIFGRSFKDLMPLLSEGSDGLRAATEDAQRLGLVMGSQAAANADAFGDQLTRLKGAISGVSISIANEWTPFLTGLVDAAANWIASMRATIGDWAKSSLDAILRIYATAEWTFNAIYDFLRKIFTADGFDSFVEGALSAFGIIMDTAANFVINLIPMMWDAFTIIWDAFVEIGKWGFQKLFDVLTGQDLAGTLGELLFERIPDATEKHRSAFIESGKKVASGIKEGVGEVGDLIGFDPAGINARVDELKNKFTEIASVIEPLKSDGTGGGTLFGDMQYDMSALIDMFPEFQDQIQSTEPLFEETTQGFLDYMAEAANAFRAAEMSASEELATGMTETFMNSAQLIGDAFASALIEGKSLGDALESVAKQVLKEVISMLIKIGVQRLILAAITKSANAAEAASLVLPIPPRAAAAAFASTAAIPIVGPILAPAAAAAAFAATSPMAAASIAGAAHGGLDSVPRESTYLLDRGERVLSPRQNTDLTDFLRTNNQSGGAITVQNMTVEVFPNVTDAGNFISMQPDEIREMVARKLIPAFDALSKQGIRPVFAG